MLYSTHRYKIKLYFVFSSLSRCEKIAFFLAAEDCQRWPKAQNHSCLSLVLLLMSRHSSCRHGRVFVTLKLLKVLSASQTAPDWIKQKFTSYLYFGLHSFLVHKKSETRAWIGLCCPTACLSQSLSRLKCSSRMESVQLGASMEQRWGATEKAGNGCGTEKSATCNQKDT